MFECMSTIPHPWETLSRLDDVVVCWRSSLPGTKHAATDGRNIIWIRKGLTQAQRRCALQHELVHLEHRHTTCQSARVELSVRRETAQRLITTSAFFDTGRWARSLTEWAEELWVTVPVLLDRVTHLSPDEQLIALDYINAARERGAD